MLCLGLTRKFSIGFSLIILLGTTAPTASSAFSLNDLNPLPGLGSLLEEGAKGLGKLGKELVNGLEDVGEVAGKAFVKIVDEVGNAAEDLRILVETGKCGGDICDGLNAIVIFAQKTVVSSVESLKHGAERLSEGKPIDALWHLATEPLQSGSANAAEAAAYSSVLRAVASTASTAYGGPAGAAAFAAWLAYETTGGDLEMAMRAGLISGATSYAMSAVGTGSETVDPKEMLMSDVASRAVASGAIAGAAVALSGGSQTDIEQAAIAGVAMSVIRDGYKKLTTHDLDRDNLKSSKGSSYCLAAPLEPAQDCHPPPEAYYRDENDQIIIEKGVPQVNVAKLPVERPHVGMFAKTDKNVPYFSPTETGGFMTFISRLPGMNAMAVAHDIFDAEFNKGLPTSVEMMVRVGSIAPAITITYEGAGYRVNELIRKEIMERAEADKPKPQPETGIPVAPPPPANAPSPEVAKQQEAGGAQTPDGADGPAQPFPASQKATEFWNLLCVGKSDTRNTLMEIPVDRGESDGVRRICSIDRLEGDRWRNLWHAHYQGKRHSPAKPSRASTIVFLPKRSLIASSASVRRASRGRSGWNSMAGRSASGSRSSRMTPALV